MIRKSLRTPTLNWRKWTHINRAELNNCIAPQGNWTAGSMHFWTLRLQILRACFFKTRGCKSWEDEMMYNPSCHVPTIKNDHDINAGKVNHKIIEDKNLGSWLWQFSGEQCWTSNKRYSRRWSWRCLTQSVSRKGPAGTDTVQVSVRSHIAKESNWLRWDAVIFDYQNGPRTPCFLNDNPFHHMNPSHSFWSVEYVRNKNNTATTNTVITHELPTRAQ